MAQKEILIYDEPTSGLDYGNMVKLCKIISKMKNKTYYTLIIIHDLELILRACHRVIHMENGRVKDAYALDDKGIDKLKEYFGV